ncbi:MAG: protein kinase, partial [Myxococcales bacterium]|nr:protein kinase [Myxococcales bacterium]
KEGPMTPSLVEKILVQTCGSLAEAHERGIVHRDLKPDNVILTTRAGQPDFVKVLDFGIAKRREAKDTQQGMVLGTPPYMSPEQFTGKPIDARSDIYSLGVMAYEMLTGRLPFQANTAWEWATQHMTQPPIPIESMAEGMRAPEAMRSAIKRALAKAPEDRFQKVKDFADAFSGLVPASPQAVAPAVAAIDLGRQKTEIGTPLQGLPGGPQGPGAPPWAGAAGPVAGDRPPRGATQGNVSFPTPAAIPQPPPRNERERGGSRSLLLGLAAVIGLASVGAIAFAMHARSGKSGPSPDFGATTSSPTPDATLGTAAPGGNAASAPTAAPTAGGESPGSSEVPPLSGGATPRPAPHASPHPAPGVGPTAPPKPGPGTTPNPTPVAPPPQVPVAPPTPPPTPPIPPTPQVAPTPPVVPPNAAKYDGPECQTARKLRALGHPREAESWALACTAKGGAP